MLVEVPNEHFCFRYFIVKYKNIYFCTFTYANWSLNGVFFQYFLKQLLTITVIVGKVVVWRYFEKIFTFNNRCFFFTGQKELVACQGWLNKSHWHHCSFFFCWKGENPSGVTRSLNNNLSVLGTMRCLRPVFMWREGRSCWFSVGIGLPIRRLYSLLPDFFSPFFF